jgi:adenine/guanine phosphoribosyltransferase-like PRPP-binding protein/trehalose-6-phosphatase
MLRDSSDAEGLTNARLEEPSRPPVADAAFFSSFDWCLNPLLPVRELIERVCLELARCEDLETSWQREESRINLYLLISAVCCATDDYLAYRPWDLAPVARRLPRIRALVSLVELCLNFPYAIRELARRRLVWRWREEVAQCLDCICDILVNGTKQARESWLRLKSGVAPRSSITLPRLLLEWRARIPEAFRCQDLSHHDVLALAQRFLRSGYLGTGPILVVGPRTAGAYFAPLVSAFLIARHIPVVSWTTIRPKIKATRRDTMRLRKLIARAERLVLVDDYPNTGDTFAMTVALLERLGARRESITVLAPDHPAQLDWKSRLHPMTTITLPFSEIYQRKLLGDTTAIGSILRQLFLDQGWDHVYLQESVEVDALNLRLRECGSDSFETRSKAVFEVRLVANGKPSVIKHVLAKSVGWGWLGYHAYIAAHRLADFVPAVVGLRHGLLFTEWIGALAPGASSPSSQDISMTLPSYVVARVKNLPLAEDPCVESIGYRRTGWDTLVRILSHPCGRFTAALKTETLKAELKNYVSPRPTLLDGGMGLSNWVKDARGVFKVDFEHHNFGGAQQDLVDPCYDLAGAIYELDLSQADEQLLVEAYVEGTNDTGAPGRLFLYKILCGVVAMQTAVYCISRARSRVRKDYWNRRYNAARNYLTFQMSLHSARGLRGSSAKKWTKHLFFLDIDGVFDSELFGPLFQHTTPSGVHALNLLKSNGYSVVLNTGRSVEHVRSYCRTYVLAGGVAEYGSVFVDAVRNVELPMIDDQGQAQLTRCCQLLQRMPGVFIDPGYRFSIRCYRYGGPTTLGLREAELRRLLGDSGLDCLKFIARDVDSYIVQKNLDKGTALDAVKQLVPHVAAPVVAIGDSIHDLEMLRKADIAYLPANFPEAERRRFGSKNYRSMKAPRQKGLLAAARDLTGDYRSNDRIYPIGNSAATDCGRLIDSILLAAEQPRHMRLLSLFNPQRI